MFQGQGLLHPPSSQSVRPTFAYPRLDASVPTCAGLDGVNGFDGMPGLDGMDGAPGPKGQRGEPGSDAGVELIMTMLAER
jgi:hypothetical protein